MGLTELIHRACVNPLTIKNEFPYKIYGQMCHKDLPVIKSTLIPYLSQKLSESPKTELNTIITYVNALGNIGVEETTEELLKVIEGRHRGSRQSELPRKRRRPRSPLLRRRLPPRTQKLPRLSRRQPRTCRRLPLVLAESANCSVLYPLLSLCDIS